MKKILLVLLLLVALLTSACGRRDQNRTAGPIAPNPTGVAVPTGAPRQIVVAQATSAPVPVPAEYQSLYKYLDGKLDIFSAQLNALPQTDARELTFAAELIVANGNRGEDLLQPQTFGALQWYLDRLQALGIKGVKVAISIRS